MYFLEQQNQDKLPAWIDVVFRIYGTYSGGNFCPGILKQGFFFHDFSQSLQANARLEFQITVFIHVNKNLCWKAVKCKH